jgi:hypothetical protein
MIRSVLRRRTGGERGLSDLWTALFATTMWILAHRV